MGKKGAKKKSKGTVQKNEPLYAQNKAQILAAIVESSHDAIVSFGFDDVIQTWNAGATRLFSYSQEEAIGDTVEDLIVPLQYREERRANFHLLRDGHQVTFPEAIRQKKSGELVVVEIVASPIFDTNQKPVAVSAIFRDLTERRQISEELARNHARYQAVIEEQTELLCRWKGDGTLTLVNKAYAQTFGLAVSEIEGTSFYDLVPLSDRMRAKIDVANLTSENPVHIQVHRVTVSDGSTRWIEWTNRLLLTPGPDGELYQATGRDVTDKYLAEEKLRESENRYRDILGSINQGFCVLEIIEDQLENPVDYRFLEVNATFERHTGLLNAVGRTATELVPGLERTWIEVYAAVARTGRPAKFEQGSAAMGRVFEVEAVKAGPAESKKVALLFSDVTQRRQIEESLKDREAKLRLGLSVANVGLCQIAYATDTIVLDDTAAQLFGLPARLAISRSDFYARFHPDEREAVSQDIAKVLHSHETSIVPIDHRILLPNGTIKWISARKQIEFGADEHGNRVPIAGLMAVYDVSERIVSAQAKMNSAARLRQAADAAQLTYFDIDLANQRIHFGDNFAEVMGYELPKFDESWIDFSKGKALMIDHVVEADRAQAAKRFEELILNLPVETTAYRVLAQDGNERWVETSWTIQKSTSGHTESAFATSINITERKHAEHQVRMLMGEVNHRSKNLLAVILSVVRQTSRTGDLATLPERISDRVSALAANQDLLVKNLWKGIDVDALVKAQLAHYKELFGLRVKMQGPSVTLTPSAAQGIGMALHELATNAGKYGALAGNEGKLNISWNVDSKRTFSMIWMESGGREVSPPTHTGFGQTVISRMVEAAVNGRVAVDFQPTGLVWTLESPLENIVQPQSEK